MEKAKLFEYAIIWHPTEKQVRDEDAKAKVIVPPSTMLASSDKQVGMKASMSIPVEYKDDIDQLQIVIRPF